MVPTSKMSLQTTRTVVLPFPTLSKEPTLSLTQWYLKVPPAWNPPSSIGLNPTIPKDLWLGVATPPQWQTTSPTTVQRSTVLQNFHTKWTSNTVLLLLIKFRIKSTMEGYHPTLHLCTTNSSLLRICGHTNQPTLLYNHMRGGINLTSTRLYQVPRPSPLPFSPPWVPRVLRHQCIIIQLFYRYKYWKLLHFDNCPRVAFLMVGKIPNIVLKCLFCHLAEWTWSNSSLHHPSSFSQPGIWETSDPGRDALRLLFKWRRWWRTLFHRFWAHPIMAISTRIIDRQKLSTFHLLDWRWLGI